MRPTPFTEYEVKELLRAKKFIYKVRENNYPTAKNNSAINEIRIRYAIRRVDSPNQDLRLQFFTRLERPAFGAEARTLPGISLNWYGERLRSISHALRHEVIQNGINIGYVKGWYEHQWTEADRDRYIVDINEDLQHTTKDLLSMMAFCLKRWNINAPEQLNLEE
jgi:hypothetical protein